MAIILGEPGDDRVVGKNHFDDRAQRWADDDKKMRQAAPLPEPKKDGCLPRSRDIGTALLLIAVLTTVLLQLRSP